MGNTEKLFSRVCRFFREHRKKYQEMQYDMHLSMEKERIFKNIMKKMRQENFGS